MSTGTGSPCGACKFLRRKCAKGCIFAPYFCHEQGASHFAAIHKVFGASNVSKLLSNLPVNDRCGAAISISYEAQARLKDPIYGCVSHIFALQQQVISLQAQLACVKEQTAQSSFVNGSASCNISTNPNDKYINIGRHCNLDQYSENSNLGPNDQLSTPNDMSSVSPAYLEGMSMEYPDNSYQFMSSIDYNEFQSMAFSSNSTQQYS